MRCLYHVSYIVLRVKKLNQNPVALFELKLTNYVSYSCFQNTSYGNTFWKFIPRYFVRISILSVRITEYTGVVPSYLC